MQKKQDQPQAIGRTADVTKITAGRLWHNVGRDSIGSTVN